ncbi:MAG TPA: choline dehydrogenase [Steroidobacteraceae bacterium]|nr:choline dehydrogenase [Steroidobacteraceae bacterium]
MTEAHYDYIIVGAGSAGCVLAARLTEDPQIRVLLIEAGPRDRSWRIDMPSAVGSLLSSDRFNWNYVSDPEPYLDGRRLTHPRGRVLGGSSSINGMVYIRGHAGDYDGWAESGLSGWGYADVLPYFKRSERHLHGADPYHGGSGPLAVFAPDLTASPLASAFVQAAAQAGYGISHDPNGERQEGFGRVDRTTCNGRRCSAARAYLAPALRRTNLEILTGALVHRIVLRGDRAVGIEFVQGSPAATVYAEREVILSAGAINSPQLLQLSGIGAAAQLAEAGIDTRIELPAVGANLNDHPDLVIQHRCLQPVSIFGANRGIGKILTGLRWFAGLGGLAGSNHFEAGGFLRSRAGIPQPDLQLTFMPLAIKPGTVEDVGMHSFQVHIDLMRPKSLGRVALRSADPAAAPSICFNYLADRQDREDLRRAVRLTREILAQPALAPYRGEELNPSAAIQGDEDIDAWVRRGVETCYHPVGTCRMGLDPRSSVVDSQCRVHGVANLRVIDASVMPAIVSGNTNAPTIMIAEKMSDTLRGKLSLPREQPAVWTHPQWATSQR